MLESLKSVALTLLSVFIFSLTIPLVGIVSEKVASIISTEYGVRVGRSFKSAVVAGSVANPFNSAK